MTRINEYYDLFDVKTHLDSGNLVNELTNNDDLPKNIRNIHVTNPFRGFSNWTNFNSANPGNNVEIIQMKKAPQAINNIKVDDDGSIWCYPPGNTGTPFWDEIIFRNFDYQIQPHDIDASNNDDKSSYQYMRLIETYYLPSYDVFPISIDSTQTLQAPTPMAILDDDSNLVPLWGNDTSTTTKIPDIFKHDYTGVYSIKEPIYDYSNVPLFLKFDQYTSRSKVIFSSCDKTRNPDITFKFGYEHGNMEPVRLTLSLSASNPLTDITTQTTRYNQPLTKHEINKLLTKCYWCIEWVKY